MEENKYYRPAFYFMIVAIFYSFGWLVYSQVYNPYFSDFWYKDIPYLLNTSLRVLFVIAAIQALQTKLKKNALLRFYACFQFASTPFNILFLVQIFSKSDRFFLINSLSYNIQLFISIIITLILPVACYIFLIETNKQKKVVFTYENEAYRILGNFESVRKIYRLIHRLVDILVIFAIVGNTITVNTHIRISSYTDLLIIEIPVFLFYYSLLEGIFKTTAGKCLTNTTVVNDVGEKPSFVQIITRTICRFIPFEALSCLRSDNRGWHDTISNTYVVKTELKDSTKDFEFEFEHQQEQ